MTSFLNELETKRTKSQGLHMVSGALWVSGVDILANI